MKQWKILHEGSQLLVHSSQQVLEILLVNRKIKTTKEIRDFMNPNLSDITLKNVGIDGGEVKKTLDLIKKTIEEKKAIVIYGDYDVDGVCATAILWETIYSFFNNVHPYIPHRVDEGYGLSEKGISNFQFPISNVGLIITVDNGIVANKAVDFARFKNINIVITDHHVKGANLPSANAIVHTTELCGTGIAYLLSQEIASKFKISRNDNHLELVALATVADLVPLNKYNRTLLKFGLEHLRKTKRPGLLALFEEAKINSSEIDTYHIGHMIAPRLNASGRITHALDSLRLVCTTDENRAGKLAWSLGEVNKERQQMTFDSALNAKEKIMNQESGITNLLFVESPEYDQGVIGLIAARLVEEFYRPSIAVSIGEKISKGSARSILGVNIIELIRSVPEFLAEAGGHPMAAGFSIETAKLEPFKKALIKKAKEIDKNLFERILKIDLELPFELISLDLYQTLQALSPFGMGNPAPVFMTHGVTIESLNKVGKDKNHLQLLLEKDGVFFKGIKFSHGNSDELKVGDIVDIVYTLDLNEWKGNKTIELRIRDLQKS